MSDVKNKQTPEWNTFAFKTDEYGKFCSKMMKQNMLFISKKWNIASDQS